MPGPNRTSPPGPDVELVQARLVTEDVAGLAAFYAGLIGAKVPLNEYYVEVPAGPASVGFAKRKFTEYGADRLAHPGPPGPGGEMILDFMVADADAEYRRIEALGVDWVLRPATQPWGSRSMVFKDPEGNLVNVFSRP
jgi:predicted enzyme related to lactoylglutathione lyase